MPLLITITGPSGTGKDAIIKMLGKRDESIVPFITCTTRSPRPGEEEGVHYYFWTQERFQQALNEGEMIEHDEHYGNFYGTPKFEVERHFALGHHTVSDINYDGVRQIRESYGTHHMAILLLPPSKERLLSRLTGRNPDLAHEGLARYKQVEADLDHLSDETYTFTNPDMRGSKLGNYDAVFINDDLEVTSFKVLNAIKEEAARRSL
ncbi:MAG: hypothetical protein COY40_06585 [Alphaproteobacteria bacterium CG_4_10_14_0_8_um_filter_53_9]|nr:MAG: hypothetical protein COY40_06585 [Alphaproteobacteria bacterium CG_4_10_14_0_8_um_filter_53_9]